MSKKATLSDLSGNAWDSDTFQNFNTEILEDDDEVVIRQSRIESGNTDSNGVDSVQLQPKTELYRDGKVYSSQG